MRKLIIILLLNISFFGFSQKIKLKKGNVLVDDIVWLKYDGCGGWDTMCSIINLSGDEIIYMNALKQENSSNPDAKYWKVKFLGTQQTIELEANLSNINGGLLKKFYESKVINEDGTLNDDKVERMVEKYGNSFSPKQNQNNTQTIIIKEEPRSGVNINIGR
jgi:hypothetical protein